MRPPRRAGLPGLLTTFAWMGGVLCLMLTAVGPAWFHFVHAAGLRDDLTEAAGQIARLQREELVVRERFLSFSTRTGKAPAFANLTADASGWLNDPRMVLTGYQKQNGHFLIRAMTRPESVTDDWLPAMLLEQELDPTGRKVRETWVEG